MERLLVTVKDLDKIGERAAAILKHIDAIKKLQNEIGPYDTVRVEFQFRG